MLLQHSEVGKDLLYGIDAGHCLDQFSKNSLLLASGQISEIVRFVILERKLKCAVCAVQGEHRHAACYHAHRAVAQSYDLVRLSWEQSLLGILVQIVCS